MCEVAISPEASVCERHQETLVVTYWKIITTGSLSPVMSGIAALETVLNHLQLLNIIVDHIRHANAKPNVFNFVTMFFTECYQGT